MRACEYFSGRARGPGYEARLIFISPFFRVHVHQFVLRLIVFFRHSRFVYLLQYFPRNYPVGVTNYQIQSINYPVATTNYPISFCQLYFANQTLTVRRLLFSAMTHSRNSLIRRQIVVAPWETLCHDRSGCFRN